MTLDDRVKRFEGRPLWESFKVVLAICLLALLLMAVLTPFGWGLAWLRTASDVTGPVNTQQQAFSLRDDYQSLRATAGNYCGARGAKSSANDPQIIGGDPSEQYAQTYRRIEADYDRRMSNAFEAGWVRHYPFLRDLPQTAPTLKQMALEVC